MTATLAIMGGLPDQAGQVFEVGSGTTTLGRGLNCDIQLADQNISRLHAELVWEEDVLVLVHKSEVNRTVVNGTEVTDRCPLVGGEEIQFADRVFLRIKIESESAAVTVVRGELKSAAVVPEAVASDESEPSDPEAERPRAPSPQAKPAPAAESAARPARESKSSVDSSDIRLAIIGAGPAGIAAAVRAAERGMSHVLNDSLLSPDFSLILGHFDPPDSPPSS